MGLGRRVVSRRSGKGVSLSVATLLASVLATAGNDSSLKLGF